MRNYEASQKLLRRLHDSLPFPFGTHKAFFQKSKNIVQLLSPPHPEAFIKAQLSVLAAHSRSGTYVRARCNDKFQSMTDELINELKAQDNQYHRPVNLCGVQSLFLEGQFYWADRNELFVSSFPSFQPLKLAQVPFTILSICLKGTNIVIRTARTVDELSLETGRLIRTHHTSEEYLQASTNPYDETDCDVVDYDTKYSAILRNRDHVCFKIEGPLYGHDRISMKEHFIAQLNRLVIADERVGRPLTILHQANPHEMILGSKWIKNQLENTPYFSVSKTRFIEIFDLRNAKQPVERFHHWSEESPPSILQAFKTPQQESGQSNWAILVISPCLHGSTLWCNILNYTQQTKSSLSSIDSVSRQTMNLLFDTGKINAGSFPQSVSPLLLQIQNKSILGFLHVDSSGGINLEAWNKNIINLPQFKWKTANVSYSSLVLEKEILDPYFSTSNTSKTTQVGKRSLCYFSLQQQNYQSRFDINPRPDKNVGPEIIKPKEFDSEDEFTDRLHHSSKTNQIDQILTAKPLLKKLWNNW